MPYILIFKVSVQLSSVAQSCPSYFKAKETEARMKANPVLKAVLGLDPGWAQS